jgi:hypothetical protein
MEFGEAALRVLSEEDGPLHWTVIQDLALRRGYLDPFAQGDIRKGVVQALSDLARAGRIDRVDKGIYELDPSASQERKRETGGERA